MPIIKPFDEFYSATVQKRYGRPNSFGQAIFGWAQFGDEDERVSVYHRRIRRADYWTRDHQPKKGIGYCKMKYYYPENPRTTEQQSNRSKFQNAVAAWQALTLSEKSVYNKLARSKPCSGYNIFISQWMKSH